MKSTLSKSVKFLRMGIKRGGATLSSKLLRSKSYPIFGIPSGLTKMDEQLVCLFPETIFSSSPPRSFQTYENPHFLALPKTFKAPAESTLTVKNGLATSTGGVLSSDGKLITTNLTLEGGTTFKDHNLFYFSTSRFFPKIHKWDKPIISLTASWQDAFYHWMLQVLPRLELIDKSQTLYVAQNTPFQKESLALLGIKNIISASAYDAVSSSEITIPSTLRSPTPRSCAYVRSLFLEKIPKCEKKRLYISREDAATRRIVNEKDVWRLLHAYGYKKVTLTGLPLIEQMALFRSASSVVATHGAGLSHLLFCDPKTSVIELFHKNYVNICYWQVASNLNLDYYHIFDQSEDTNLDPDIDVDLVALRQTLDRCHR